MQQAAMGHYLQERYRKEIAPALMKEIGVRSSMQVPRLKKIIVNVGVGEALENAKALDSAVEDIMTILGNGRNAMPAFGTVLTPEQMHDTGAFIVKELVKE